jgi:Ca2+-binding EF-hand superfamily protein
MSESKRRRQILQSIQSRILTLGNSNRDRWNIFSIEPEITIEQFCQRIGALGISIEPHEILTLWRAVGISNDTMQFADFVRFLQASSEDICGCEDSSVKRSKNISEIFGTNYKRLLGKFAESDPTITGFITHRAFNDIAAWYGLTNRSDIRMIVQKYDDGSGNITYFQFIADLCYDSFSPPQERRAPPPPSIDTSFSTSFESFTSSPISPCQSYQPQSGSELRYTPQLQRSPRRNDCDDSFSRDQDIYPPQREMLNHSYDGYATPPRRSPKPVPFTSPRRNDSRYSPRLSGGSPSSGGRGKLDPEIFGQYSPRSPPTSPSSGGRGKLDPAIFGEKPVIQTVIEQPEFNADDCVNAERINGLTPAQLIELISKQVGKHFRRGKQAYIKWRGKDDLLTANDIRNGLAKDANIVVPLRDINVVMNQYGGPFSLSTFIRMLSDGASLAENKKSPGGMRQITENEAAIIRIAEQVHGNEWEIVVAKARNAEEMCRGLKNLGIRVSQDDIRVLMAKLGRSGLIKAINMHL